MSKKFFGRICRFISFCRYVSYKLIPHLIALAFTMVGLYAWKADILWLLIVSGLAALFARMYGYIVPMAISSELPKPLMSNIVLLIVSVLASFLLRVRMEIGFVESIFLAVHGLIPVFYVLIIVFWVVINLRIKSWYKRELRAMEKIQKQKAVDQALAKLGITRKQVKYIHSDRKYDAEKDAIYYEVVFYRGERRCEFKIYDV